MKGMELSIQKVDERSILKIGNESIEIKDYKISSSMRDGTELEIVIPVKGNIMEFSTSTNQES
jgi:hypothetical protein